MAARDKALDGGAGKAKREKLTRKEYEKRRSTVTSHDRRRISSYDVVFARVRRPAQAGRHVPPLWIRNDDG